MTNLGHVYVLKSKYRDELNNLKKERKMNSTLLVNIFRFILLLAVQIVIFNNMNFLGFIMPLPYLLFIILYPVNGNRSGLLITSFLLGLTMDVFSNSGGVHAAACVTLAYFRPYIFKFAFGISYQTIKLNDVLTPERFSFINFSNNSSHVIYIRSVSSQFLLGHITHY
jgi:hypothetical protein